MEKVLTYRSWRLGTACLHGRHGEVKAGYTEKRQDLGTCLHDVHGLECFGVPRLRPDWSLQTKTSRAVVSSVGLLPKGHPGRRGRPFLDRKGCGGTPTRNLHLLVTLHAVIQGMDQRDGRRLVSGLHRWLGQTTWTPRQQCRGVAWLIAPHSQHFFAAGSGGSQERARGRRGCEEGLAQQPLQGRRYFNS